VCFFSSSGKKRTRGREMVYQDMIREKSEEADDIERNTSITYIIKVSRTVQAEILSKLHSYRSNLARRASLSRRLASWLCPGYRSGWSPLLFYCNFRLVTAVLMTARDAFGNSRNRNVGRPQPETGQICMSWVPPRRPREHPALASLACTRGRALLSTYRHAMEGHLAGCNMTGNPLSMDHCNWLPSFHRS